MIELRQLKNSDIESIDKIYRKQPEVGVPSLNNMIINRVIDNNGEVIGYGALKLFAEAVLILNKDIPKRDKVQAVTEIMTTAILYSRDAGLEMIYAISNSESFTKCLENRFKFKRVPGTLLCLDLTSSFEDK